MDDAQIANTSSKWNHLIEIRSKIIRQTPLADLKSDTSLRNIKKYQKLKT